MAEARETDTLSQLGVWRSLVARSVRVGEVPSSNLGTPISVGEPMVPPRAPSFSALPRAAAGYGRMNRPSPSEFSRLELFVIPTERSV